LGKRRQNMSRQQKEASAFGTAYSAAYRTVYKSVYDVAFAEARSKYLSEAALSSAKYKAEKFEKENAALKQSDPGAFRAEREAARQSVATYHAVDDQMILLKAVEEANTQASSSAAVFALSAAIAACEQFDNDYWDED
jgi:hypothetical protein